jgi:hypothetical protein
MLRFRWTSLADVDAPSEIFWTQYCITHCLHGLYSEYLEASGTEVDPVIIWAVIIPFG